MSFKKIILSCGTVLLVLIVMPIANAKSDENSYQVGNINDSWGLQLSKEGYVFRLDPDRNNDGLWSEPTGKNRYRITTHKTLRQLIHRQTNFKIYRVWQYQNGLQYKVVSQSGRYRGWIDHAGVYNKYSLDPQLQLIIRQEKRVINSVNAKYPNTTHYHQVDFKKYQNDLIRATKIAQNLNGNQKTVALKSLKEVKEYLKDRRSDQVPTILWP